MAGNGFGELLRTLRQRAGLTQAQLAAAAELSADSIASYEEGRRRPDARGVERLGGGLALGNGEYNDLRVAAGLRPMPSGLEAALRKFRAPAETLWDEVQESPWVTLVLNERREIVAWNGLANSVSDRDLGELDQFHRSVFRMAATDHYERHLVNWDQLIGRLIALFRQEGSDLAQQEVAAFVEAVVASITKEDPRFLPRIFDLFVKAEPWDDYSRNIHPVHWRLDDGTELRFQGAFADWSQYDGLWAFDWHAADAETADWVNEQLAGPDWTSEAPPRMSFPEALAHYRQKAYLSRASLAERAGVSAAAIAAYESGTRSPSRESLLALTRALNVDGYATNQFLRDAGFEEEPGDWARFMSGEEPRTVYERHAPLRPLGAAAIFAMTDRLPFPSVVLDGGCHALHANPLARKLVDFGRYRPLSRRPGPHLLQMMVSPFFLEAVENWDEVAGVFLPGRLQHPVLGSETETSTSALVSLGRELRATHREGLDRMAAVWMASQNYTSLRRPGIQVRWRTPDGEALAFNCTASGITPRDPYKSLDFYPADAATFRWVEANSG